MKDLKIFCLVFEETAIQPQNPYTQKGYHAIVIFKFE